MPCLEEVCCGDLGASSEGVSSQCVAGEDRIMEQSYQFFPASVSLQNRHSSPLSLPESRPLTSPL